MAGCAHDAMQHEVYSITYDLFAPRMLNLKLLRLLDLASSLWEVQVIEKQIKYLHVKTFRQIQNMEQDNWPGLF